MFLYKQKVDVSSWYHSIGYLDFDFPDTCPHCGRSYGGSVISKTNISFKENTQIFIVVHHCPATPCNKRFFTTHLFNTSDKTTQYISTYPTHSQKEFDKLLADISPKFVELYNVAYALYQENKFDVAGAVYRMSLEFLMKDYLISFLKEPEEEVVKCNLGTTITKYFKNVADMYTAAEVVRELGNDNSHYRKKYDDVSINELVVYLDIFINHILTKLKIANPPIIPRPV